jgi:hypothetical protein
MIHPAQRMVRPLMVTGIPRMPIAKNGEASPKPREKPAAIRPMMRKASRIRPVARIALPTWRTRRNPSRFAMPSTVARGEAVGEGVCGRLGRAICGAGEAW